jgi:ketosteroid isomerase-like protein/GNAT superfamily N-acetyltransferase
VTAEVNPLAPAEARDEVLVKELARLINGAYALGETGLWLEGATRTKPGEIAEAIRSGGMLAATLEGRVVGCAYVWPLDAGTADLGLLAAVPERWGSGVGRELVRSAEELMRSRGVATMQVELLVPKESVHPQKDRLRAWYTRLGYRFVGSAPFEHVAAHLASELATPCEFLIFRKSLAESPGSHGGDTAGRMAQEKLQIVDELIDAWNRGDLHSALERMHPQCEVRPIEATEMLHGHDGVAGAFRDWFEAFEEFTIEVEDRITQGDRVLVTMRQRARGKGSGLEIEEPRYQLFAFRDGKVVRFEEYSDEADALKALGK